MSMTIDAHYEVTFDDEFLARWRDDRIEAHVAWSKYRIARMREKLMGTLGTKGFQTLGFVCGIGFLVFAIVCSLDPLGDTKSAVMLLMLGLSACVVSTSRFINWIDGLGPVIVRARVSRQIDRQAEELAIKAPLKVRLDFRHNELTLGSDSFDQEQTIRFVPNRMVAIKTNQLFVVFGRAGEIARFAFINDEQEHIAFDFLRTNSVKILAVQDETSQNKEERNRC